MEKLLQYKQYAVYKKADGELITKDGKALTRTPYARIKSWVTSDYKIGYEENREVENEFLFQRLSFIGEDKCACTFAVSMQGLGNIPWQYAMALYEKLDMLPGILKKNRPMWGGHYEDEESGCSLERGDSRIYPWQTDRQGRVTRATVASGDKTKTGWIYNAFDLKITYEGQTIKPKTVKMLPPEWHIVAKKYPSARGTVGREISETTHALLGKFGIDSTQIITPKKRIIKNQGISR